MVLNGLDDRPCIEAVDSAPATPLTVAGLGAPASVDEPPLVLLSAFPELPFAPYLEYGLLFAVGTGGFILCPIKVFKLLSSTLSSFNLISVDSFCPSMALGIKSFSPRTSSLIRLDSCSRSRLAVFNSPITLSTSVKAVSKRSVRACSEVFKASVSLASCSKRENAFSKDSSIACLSCSSCGVVGGAIIGYT